MGRSGLHQWLTKPCSAIALFGLLSSDARPQQPANDWLIVPNVRVGPITASSTERSLREAFGDKSVEKSPPFGAEGPIQAGALIYPKDLSRVISVTWRGKGERELPDTIAFCFGFHTSRWHTPSGIGCDTTVRELESLNRGPFTLSGYGRDNSGTVMSWQSGALERELAPKGALEIAVSPGQRDWMTNLTPEERRTVFGDNEIRSGDPVIQRLNPVVYKIIFKFPEGTGVPALKLR